jgi:ubiquitin-protein ligase
MTSAIKLIIKECNEIRNEINTDILDNHRFIDIITNDSDVYKFNVVFLGPKDSPYEETINTISVCLQKDYPNKAPTIKFINKIYHPNVSYDGSICLDVLKENWKPIYTLRTIIMSIISLLSDPNPDSPLNGEAAKLYKESIKSIDARRKYKKKIELFSNDENKTKSNV